MLRKPLRWIERLPIVDKIGMPLSAIAVLTATALSFNSITMIRQQIDQCYKAQALQVANLVQSKFNASQQLDLTDRTDRPATSQFLRQLEQQDAAITKIYIYRIVDQQPLLWAASEAVVPPDYAVEPADVSPLLTGQPRQVLNEMSAELETTVPLVIDGKPVASLSIYSSLQDRDRTINAATRSTLITSAFGISAQSAALMLVLYWGVLRRIKRLSHASLRVAAGDTHIRLPEPPETLSEISSRDEILHVTREFNRMLAALEHRAQQQEALNELAQQALAEIDLSELLDKVAGLVVRTLKVDQVEILELLPELNGLKLRAGAGGESAITGQITPVTVDSPPDYMLRTSQPVVIDNLSTEHRFAQLDLLQQQGVISSISVLIAHLDRPFGILSVHSRTQRSFLSDDLAFLKAVASLTSTAIDRHRLETVMTQAKAAIVRAETAEIAKQALETEIVERQRVEAALRESEERYALAASGANDGLWDWNLRSNEVYFSHRWKTMLGYSEAEIGSSPHEWFDRIHPDDYERVQMEIRHHREGLTAHFESEFRLRQKDGSYCWMLSRGLAVRDPAGNLYRIAGSQTDVTARKLAEDQLLHIALHDELTGLANRALFTDRLDRAIARTNRRQQASFAVLFLDLDRFKVINDSLGHLVGDQLLVATAERLRRCLRSSDTCARLGGDEFAILLEDIQEPDDAITLVERISTELRDSFVLAGQEIFVNASIGLVLDTERYRNKEELLRDADTAMYRSKANGRGRYTVFTPNMHQQAMTLLHLEADLRRAIERQELLLFYQPILALNSQRLTGFEALLRWQHPTRGLLLPADFIPVAEETGLIISIGWWVLREAAAQMQQWQSEFDFDSSLTMSVNLSGKQFAQPDLVSRIAAILQETGLEPQRLKLEITESVIMTNADAAAQMMQQLKAIGVQLAMDDFGTGYSSLSYLHRFPIDTLKIDRSFINSADSDLEKLEITRTVIALAWNLGMNVVAEGVETDRQMAQLKLLKCELGQGFLFSHPLDKQATAELLHQGLATSST
ncbi:MAG: EAL domain-containing protein [Pegethrix bostrychoides GSE-TBD4-15B]|uniref:EAL domain-containing protein n=1 Tax=Pegethrix bostrychoides GSE-TBD4-15B TaxID=2839662 RepID=A0A951U4H1_9CYAN|nr:EAL domain-containing protein [Pegethrix bostrychoides GSE-TBD4-15B]